MSHCALGIDGQTVIDSPLLTEKLGINRTIKVDINGNGEFKSIQAAIVPFLKEISMGLSYIEKVHIPENKPYIFMRGNGKGKTAIVWSQSSEDNVASATFKVEAHDFIAFGISFKAPTGVAYTSQNQSVAADKYSTLSSIAKVDIITIVVTFKGQLISYLAVADRSSIGYIFVVDDKRVTIKGSVTAQNRESEGEMSGFIFIKGKVYDIGGVYLGRAKGPYSRVIFAETYLSMTIVPEG
ncbi:putative pectinesterase 67 [Glycine soja]